MNSDSIPVTGIIHGETDGAILFSDDGDKEYAVWLPKHQIEIERKRNRIAIVTMPVSLAKKWEFI